MIEVASILGLVLGLGSMLYVMSDVRRRRQRCRKSLAEMMKRPKISLGDECAKLAAHDPTKPVALIRIWMALAKYYGLPATYVRREDRLDQALRPFWGDPDKMLIYLSHDLGRLSTRVDSAPVQTWGDLVMFVHACEQQVGQELLPSPLCACCGYDLRFNESHVCPECGVKQPS